MSDNVNVYINEIYKNGNQDRGVACPNKMIIGLSEGAECNLLAHEIGHLLGLTHLSSLGSSNFMNDKTCDRNSITDGQVMAVHYSQASCLNKLTKTPSPTIDRTMPCQGLQLSGEIFNPKDCVSVSEIGGPIRSLEPVENYFSLSGDAYSSPCINSQFDFDDKLASLPNHYRKAIRNSLGIS